MAVDDFDTSHSRECMECHRSGFDDGDWQFVGYDDDAELYICPDCVAISRDYDDTLRGYCPKRVTQTVSLRRNNDSYKK